MIGRVATLALGAAMLAGSASALTCEEDSVLVTGGFGQARFAAQIADEPAERSKGLMFVEEMGTLEGMLFLYDAPQHATFWMRNTLIPLDMLFADETGTITHIHENAVPMDETVIDGGRDVLAVLEINGGMAARLGIAEGDRLHHPLLGGTCPPSE